MCVCVCVCVCVCCPYNVCCVEDASEGGDVEVPYTFTNRDVILYALGGVCVCVYVHVCV